MRNKRRICYMGLWANAQGVKQKRRNFTHPKFLNRKQC